VDEARSTVTITSERKAEKEDKQEGWLLRERSYGKSQRSVLLPETADLHKAEVELKVSIQPALCDLAHYLTLQYLFVQNEVRTACDVLCYTYIR
jgi:Hsp20/alpha crystallin family